MEIINISTKNGKLVALMSYQNIEPVQGDLNNGYDTVEIPINLREIQLSSRGNMLVDQSAKGDSRDVSSCWCDNGTITCPGCNGEQSKGGVCAGCHGEGRVTCGKCGGKR